MMKSLLKILPLIVLGLFLAGCSKNNRETSVSLDSEAKGKPAIPGGKILNGELDVLSTRVYMGGYDPLTSKYLYLWSKTPTKTLTLFIKQDPLAGVNQTDVTTTLSISPDGKCTFSATVPAWFDPTRDYVAGAIDVASTTATPGNWNFVQPSSIDAAGESYLPMFFPLTKPTNGSLKASFQTMGSVLAVRVTNNTAANYTLDRLHLNSNTFSTSGNILWNNLSSLPAWTGLNPGSTNTISVSNCVIAPGQTDTVYVWVKQQLTNLSPIYIIAKNPTGLGPTIIRPAPLAVLADNKFYGLAVSVDVPSVGNLPVSYFRETNENKTGGNNLTYLSDANGNTYYNAKYVYDNVVASATSTVFRPAGWHIPTLDESYILAPFFADAGGYPPLSFSTTSPTGSVTGVVVNIGGVTYTMDCYFTNNSIFNQTYGIYSFTNQATGKTLLYSRRYYFYYDNGTTTNGTYTGGGYTAAYGLLATERFYAGRAYTAADLATVANEAYWALPAYEVKRFFPALGTLSSGTNGVFQNLKTVMHFYTSNIGYNGNSAYEVRSRATFGAYVRNNTTSSYWRNVRYMSNTVTIGY